MELFMRTGIRVFLLSVGLLFSMQCLPAQMDTYSVSGNYQFQQLVPVNLVAPSKPMSRFGPGPEGWIKLRYSIKADGSVANVEVLDVMPESFPTQDTVRAVRSWTFQPAVVDGSPVDWHNNLIVINFDLQEIPNLSGPGFTTPYSEVQALISNGQYDKAETQSIRNLKDSTFTLHDIGLGNMQLALIEVQRKDFHRARQAIVRATLPEVTELTKEELDVALQYRFNVELALERYFDAMETYELRSRLTDIPADDTMRKQAELITEGLTGDYTVKAKGRILDEDKGWFFIPSQRIFSIADVDGRLENITVACNRRMITLKFQPDVEWELPESWGDCSLSVMGKTDTSFTFYEFQSR